MQRIFVDFGRGLGDTVDILTTAQPNSSLQLRANERVLLYDSTLEVEGVLRQEQTSDGQTFWVAIPDWATQRDLV